MRIVETGRTAITRIDRDTGIHVMEDSEQRQIGRDSLFVLVDLRLENSDELHRIKMRNLSSGGMMGDGPVRVARGLPVWVNLRNIGWVEGTVAWVQDNRFGIAFREEVDPKVVRVVQAEIENPLVVARNHIVTPPSPGIIRKI